MSKRSKRKIRRRKILKSISTQNCKVCEGIEKQKHDIFLCMWNVKSDFMKCQIIFQIKTFNFV